MHQAPNNRSRRKLRLPAPPAAVLRLQAGAGASALQVFLGRKSLQETRHYIIHLGSMLSYRRLRPGHASRFVPRLGWSPPGPFQRKRPRSHPNNQHAAGLNFLAGSQLQFTPTEFDAFHTAGIENEIVALRVLLSRAFQISGSFEDPMDIVRAVNVSSRAALRLSRLLLQKKKLESLTAQDELNDAIAAVDRELSHDQSTG